MRSSKQLIILSDTQVMTMVMVSGAGRVCNSLGMGEVVPPRSIVTVSLTLRLF